jgi:hypothetical protein
MMVEMVSTNNPYSSWVMPQQTMKIDGNESHCALHRVDCHDQEGKKEANRLERSLNPMAIIGVPGRRNLLLMVDLVYPVQGPGMQEHMREVEPDIVRDDMR